MGMIICMCVADNPTSYSVLIVKRNACLENNLCFPEEAGLFKKKLAQILENRKQYVRFDF